MIAKIENVLTIGFCAFWAFIIFLDYWYFHPEYWMAILAFKYIDLTTSLLVVGGVIGWIISYMTKKGKPIFFSNGLGVLALLLIISGQIIYFHFLKIGGDFDISIGEIFTYLGKISLTILAVYVVLLTAFSVGGLLFKKIFSFKFNKIENILLKITLGIVVISVMLFLLGTVNLLMAEVILPIVLLLLIINWRENWQFVKSSLLASSQNIQQLNWIGLGSFYLLLIFIALIFLQNIRPYPFGFDALAIYLNLPRLIGENQGLIEGFSPYYWSLFIALGYIVFDHIEVVMALSVTGGILSAFFIYEICRKWLDVNYSILTVLIFYSLPMINYQSYRDIKTDLGLLFILLATILVLIKWLSLEDRTAYKSANKYTLKKKKIKSKGKKKAIPATKVNKVQAGILEKYFSESTQLIILLGIFSGMAIGIKLTGLILIFSVLAVLAYMKGGEIGFLTAFALSFAIILLGGLEVASGLRAYHFGADMLKVVFSLLGVGGLIYLFITNRKDLLELVRMGSIYIGFVGLIYIPWPFKNYQETNSLSINTFITGKYNNHLMDYRAIIKSAKEIDAQDGTSK